MQDLCKRRSGQAQQRLPLLFELCAKLKRTVRECLLGFPQGRERLLYERVHTGGADRYELSSHLQPSGLQDNPAIAPAGTLSALAGLTQPFNSERATSFLVDLDIPITALSLKRAACPARSQLADDVGALMRALAVGSPRSAMPRSTSTKS